LFSQYLNLKELMSRKIVVAGVTGNIGSKLAARLTELGHQVTGIARDQNKFNSLKLQHVSFQAGELHDAPFLTAALKEADAAFLLIPPNVTAPDVPAYQKEIGEAIAQAVKNSGIQYVVNLSSQGADLAADTGPVVGVHLQEQRLNQIAWLNVLHLRPGYFMENLLANIPMIQQMGIMGSAFLPDLAIPMIATQDIAEVAVQALDQLDFESMEIRDLLGPRDVSMGEATQAIGKAIGKPELPYVQFSYEDSEKGMQQGGLSASMAALYTEMTRSANEKGIFNRITRTPENSTPTSLEQFIESVKGAFAGVAAY
jgi:uncharacterized protein YbjT (DUF2867 family)